MRFQSITDAKNEMEKIINSMSSSDVLYNDFKWFSKVNYTTTTEYYGELRSFLNGVLCNSEYKIFHKDLRDLCRAIDEVFLYK